MSETIAVIGWGLLVFSLCGAIYTVAAGLALGWFVGRPAPAASVFPPVTILKPLHGDEPGLRQCLQGFCAQDYPGPVQIVFGVRDAFDPAIRVVRALICDNPGRDIALVVDSRVWGANLKISNLINMQAVVKHPMVVLADSDVSVTPGYLRQLAGALADPSVGFATCAFLGVPTGNLWSRLSAMAINHHFLPSVALGVWLKLARPCFGPTVAFRREVFDRAGGFARFADRLADDYEIGDNIHALGYRSTVLPMLVGHGCPERSGRRMIAHELRWVRTIRLIDPLGYAGSLVCHPLLFALAACVLLHGATPALAALALVAASRLFVINSVSRLTEAQGGGWWLFPLRDLLSVAVHVGGFLPRTVEWRGRRFRIGRDGALTPIHARPVRAAFEPVSSLATVAATPVVLVREPSSAA